MPRFDGDLLDVAAVADDKNGLFDFELGQAALEESVCMAAHHQDKMTGGGFGKGRPGGVRRWSR